MYNHCLTFEIFELLLVLEEYKMIHMHTLIHLKIITVQYNILCVLLHRFQVPLWKYERLLYY